MVQSLRALGHEPILIPRPVAEIADVAIVNLGSTTIRAVELVPALNALDVHVIGHAGHKEKELLELGRAAGCRTVATNSQLTYKLPELLSAATSSRSTADGIARGI